MTTANLETIQKRYESIKTTDLSEIDTQILLVEPILQLAGWDLYNPSFIKRASRSKSKPSFDLEAYEYRDESETVFLAIECKSLNSREFNYRKLPSKRGVGKLTQKQHKDLSIYWANDDKDGIGQLRAYCLRYSQFSEEDSRALLTNGEEWLLFNNEMFLAEGSLENKITDDAIKEHAKLIDDDFEKRIIEQIRVRR